MIVTLVVLLLVALPEGTPYPDCVWSLSGLDDALARYGVESDWMDAEEPGLGREESDPLRGAELLRFVQERRDYCDGLPHSWEVMRFPEVQALRDQLDLNQGFQDYCDRQAEFYDWWPHAQNWWYGAKAEAQRLRAPIDCTEDCWLWWEPRWFRRKRLKDLHEMIGDVDYSLGRLPPCVPYYLFPNPDR